MMKEGWWSLTISNSTTSLPAVYVEISNLSEMFNCFFIDMLCCLYSMCVSLCFSDNERKMRCWGWLSIRSVKINHDTSYWFSVIMLVEVWLWFNCAQIVFIWSCCSFIVCYQFHSLLDCILNSMFLLILFVLSVSEVDILVDLCFSLLSYAQCSFAYLIVVFLLLSSITVSLWITPWCCSVQDGFEWTYFVWE